MKAMVMEQVGSALRSCDLPVPSPRDGQVLVRIEACAVCRTDLHIVDGDLPDPKLPLVPGHEIVGVVEETGAGGSLFGKGDRIGIPWLGKTCRSCDYCTSGLENLCQSAEFTGYTLDGGYAEHCLADERYCLPIPGTWTPAHAAPLLCAGLIGYRAYRKTGDAARLGFYGFGASAHILAQIATKQGREILAFTRQGDSAAQQLARKLGCSWAGGSEEDAPELLDAAIIFAPVGALVPQALRNLRPGGKVVCAGIHMSDIPSFPYELLWRERSIESVANLTRADGIDFL